MDCLFFRRLASHFALTLLVVSAMAMSALAKDPPPDHPLRDQRARRDAYNNIRHYTVDSNWWAWPDEARASVLKLLEDPETTRLLQEQDASTLPRSREAYHFIRRAESPPYNIDLDPRSYMRRALSRFNQENQGPSSRGMTHIEAERIARSELNISAHTDLSDPQMLELSRRLQLRINRLEEETTSTRARRERVLSRRNRNRIEQLFEEERQRGVREVTETLKIFCTDELGPNSFSNYFEVEKDYRWIRTINDYGTEVPPGFATLKNLVTSAYPKSSSTTDLLVPRSRLPLTITELSRRIESLPSGRDFTKRYPRRYRSSPADAPSSHQLETLFYLLDLIDSTDSPALTTPLTSKFVEAYAPRPVETKPATTGSATDTSGQRAANNPENGGRAVFEVRGDPQPQVGHRYVIAPELNMRSERPERVQLRRRLTSPSYQVATSEASREVFRDGRIAIPSPEQRELQSFEILDASTQNRLRAGVHYEIRRDPLSEGYFVTWIGDSAPPAAGVTFVAGFESRATSREPRRPTVDPQIFSNLDRTRISRAANQMEEAGLTQLAERLRTRLLNPRPVDARELEDLFKKTGFYSYQTEGVPLTADQARGNRYTHFAHFTCTGAAHYQCDGSNQLLQTFLNDVLENSPHLRAHGRFTFAAEPGQTILTTDDAHMENDLRVGDQTAMILDATPIHLAGTNGRPLGEGADAIRARHAAAQETDTWNRLMERHGSELRSAREEIVRIGDRIPRAVRGSDPLSRVYLLEGMLADYFEQARTDPETALTNLRRRLAEKFPGVAVPEDLANVRLWLRAQVAQQNQIVGRAERARLRSLSFFNDPEIRSVFERHVALIEQNINSMSAPPTSPCSSTRSLVSVLSRLH